MRRGKITRLVAVLTVASGTIGIGASMAAATKADPHKVTICHATASATNPYVVITVDIASIVGYSGHGHSGVNIGDIIPPITVDGVVVYPGNNWDSAHQAILDNGCDATTTTTQPTNT